MANSMSSGVQKIFVQFRMLIFTGISLLCVMRGDRHRADSSTSKATQIATATGWKSLNIVNGLTFVRKTENGSRWFLIDTGCRRCVLDSKALGYPWRREMITVNMLTEAQREELRNIGGIFNIAESGPFDIIDLSDLRLVAGINVVGIIGSSAFSSKIIQIDIAGRRVREVTQSKDNVPDYGESYPMESRKGDLVCELTVNGKNATWMQIDTGFNGFMCIPEDWISQFGWRDEMVPQFKRVLTLDGFHEDPCFFPEQFQVGAARYVSPCIAVGNLKCGLIGDSFFGDYIVTIDCKAGTLYLSHKV